MSWRASLVNLPHAATIANRLVRALTHTHQPSAQRSPARDKAVEIFHRLHADDDLDGLDDETTRRLCDALVGEARLLVDRIEAQGIGNDRLGQHVRNFFECLGYAQEGAALSLRAGEDPNSMQRP